MRPISIALIFLLSFALIMGKPQKEQLKEQELSNNVNPDRKEEETESEVKVTVIPPDVDHNHRPGAAVVRIIDDIFQIPIGVLQSVSRLLKNPFISKKKTPETVSSY